jgi:hypothetical protein
LRRETARRLKIRPEKARQREGRSGHR